MARRRRSLIKQHGEGGDPKKKARGGGELSPIKTGLLPRRSDGEGGANCHQPPGLKKEKTAKINGGEQRRSPEQKSHIAKIVGLTDNGEDRQLFSTLRMCGPGAGAGRCDAKAGVAYRGAQKTNRLSPSSKGGLMLICTEGKNGGRKWPDKKSGTFCG